MSFYIGQKVVCVDAKTKTDIGLVEGQVYVIRKEKKCCQRGHWVDVGILATHEYNGSTHCPYCFDKQEGQKIQWTAARRFVPLEDYEAMNELVKELTTPKLQEA